MLNALLKPYRVTISGYRDAPIVHRAASFREALAWVACSLLVIEPLGLLTK